MKYADKYARSKGYSNAESMRQKLMAEAKQSNGMAEATIWVVNNAVLDALEIIDQSNDVEVDTTERK